MARRLIRYVQYNDDLDGSPLDDTGHKGVVFAWNGAFHVLDLKPEHFEQLSNVMEPLVAAAHDHVKFDKDQLALGGGVDLDEPSPRRKKVKASREDSGQLALRAAPEAPNKQKLSAIKHGLPRDMRQRLRAWADDNGYNVAPRGIVAAEVTEAYLVAHEHERPILEAYRAERLAEIA